MQSSRICALFWGTKKSVQQQVLDSSLGDFTLTGSGSEVFSFDGPITTMIIWMLSIRGCI